MNTTSKVALVLLAVATSAIAQTPGQEKAEADALKDCSANQASMSLCAHHNYRVADAELNNLYTHQMGRLKGSSHEKSLRAAQRAWLQYVEADCLYQIGPAEEGGSSWAMERAYCFAGHINERIKYLRSYVACRYEGCPGET